MEFGLSSPRSTLSGKAGVSATGGDHPIPTLSRLIIQWAPTFADGGRSPERRIAARKVSPGVGGIQSIWNRNGVAGR